MTGFCAATKGELVCMLYPGRRTVEPLIMSPSACFHVFTFLSRGMFSPLFCPTSVSALWPDWIHYVLLRYKQAVVFAVFSHHVAKYHEGTVGSSVTLFLAAWRAGAWRAGTVSSSCLAVLTERSCNVGKGSERGRGYSYIYFYILRIR